jgi:hypothetical protein
MLHTELLRGPLVGSPQIWPLLLHVRLCDLRPCFLPKARVGRSYRAIARNGRVLLATNRHLEEWIDRPAEVRLQTWHRAILPAFGPNLLESCCAYAAILLPRRHQLIRPGWSKCLILPACLPSI